MNSDVYRIQAQQGWTDATMLLLRERYIDEQPDVDFVEWLDRIAQEENEECEL